MPDDQMDLMPYEPEVEVVEVEPVRKHDIPLLIDLPQGQTTQKESYTDPWSDYGTKVIEPPIDPRLLCRLTQTSPVRGPIIDAIARNTVGLGYEVVNAPMHEHDSDE